MNEPHAKRGWLRHGNPPGDPSKSPRCGARTRAGMPCKAPGMRDRGGAYGRCRMHGGAAARANWKNGTRSAQANAEAKKVRALLRDVNAAIEAL
jgi:hypothetical protein